MSKEVQIHFVTWPDGRIVEGSQTSVDEKIAVGNALRACLLHQYFPGVDLTQAYYGSLSQLWRAMQEAGFKLQSISIDATGVAY